MEKIEMVSIIEAGSPTLLNYRPSDVKVQVMQIAQS